MHNGTGWVTKSAANADVTLRVSSGAQVDGNIGIPGEKEYRYLTRKNRSYGFSPFDMVPYDPTNYLGVIDLGRSTDPFYLTSSLWAATTPGSAGIAIPAYFSAPIHLPDSAVITGLRATLINFGSSSSKSYVYLVRVPVNGGSTDIIRSITFNGSGSGTPTILDATTFGVRIENTQYYYYLRWLGEKSNKNIRFVSASINYYKPFAD